MRPEQCGETVLGHDWPGVGESGRGCRETQGGSVGAVNRLRDILAGFGFHPPNETRA